MRYFNLTDLINNENDGDIIINDLFFFDLFI